MGHTGQSCDVACRQTTQTSRHDKKTGWEELGKFLVLSCDCHIQKRNGSLLYLNSMNVGEQVSCPVGWLQEIIHKLNGTPGPWWKRSGSCYCLLWLILVVVILLALNWSCYTVFWVNKPYLACLFKWTTAWWTVVLARQKVHEAVLPEKRFLLSNFLKVSCNELFSSLFPFSNSSRQKSTKTSIYIMTNGQHHHRSVFLVAND